MRDRIDATAVFMEVKLVLVALARPGSLNDSTELMPPMGNRTESSRGSLSSITAVWVKA
ncbi:MAG: hypothetical protein IPI48_09685 [bacterium]|nr:hypothetical protein [bacterium]